MNVMACFKKFPRAPRANYRKVGGKGNPKKRIKLSKYKHLRRHCGCTLWICLEHPISWFCARGKQFPALLQSKKCIKFMRIKDNIRQRAWTGLVASKTRTGFVISAQNSRHSLSEYLHGEVPIMRLSCRNRTWTRTRFRYKPKWQSKQKFKPSCSHSLWPRKPLPSLVRFLLDCSTCTQQLPLPPCNAPLGFFPTVTTKFAGCDLRSRRGQEVENMCLGQEETDEGSM